MVLIVRARIPVHLRRICEATDEGCVTISGEQHSSRRWWLLHLPPGVVSERVDVHRGCAVFAVGFRVTVSVPLRLQSATTTQSKENSVSITGRFTGVKSERSFDHRVPLASMAHTRQKRARLMTSCTVTGGQGTLCFQTAVYSRVGLFRLRACLTPAIWQLAIAAQRRW